MNEAPRGRLSGRIVAATHNKGKLAEIRDLLEPKSAPEIDLEGDPLLEEAKALVYDTATASTTFLQRKLKIGYARAASLMDALEAAGVVGPQDGAKPRKIYYPGSGPRDEF